MLLWIETTHKKTVEHSLNLFAKKYKKSICFFTQKDAFFSTTFEIKVVFVKQRPLQEGSGHYKKVVTVDQLPEGATLDIDWIVIPFGSIPIELWEITFELRLLPLPMVMTLLPHLAKQKDFFRSLVRWKLRYLEVRDDLLDAKSRRSVVNLFPVKNILRSYRIHDQKKELDIPWGATDWGIELGIAPFLPTIYSSHTRVDNFKDSFIFPTHATRALIWKVAIPIKNFQELAYGHAWWREDPKRRVFCPCSKDGRWQWYRNIFAPQMPLNFFRLSTGLVLDKPFLYQALGQYRFVKTFAAILGEDVQQSLTPSFQQRFFQSYRIPVVPISILRDEWLEALPILRKMGLMFAAVTSPFKKDAYQLSQKRTVLAQQLESVNTLAYADGQWHGHNTDDFGLKSFLKKHLIEQFPVVVWGGGGVLSILKKYLPHATFISARIGGKITKPSVLIWAAGNGSQVQLPEQTQFIRHILDLGYTKNSIIKRLAQQLKIPYVSGKSFFIQQGYKQRRYSKMFFPLCKKE